jgi:hypothetical protein
VVATKILATKKFTQLDGATVFVRELSNGKFNVVVQNESGQLITNLKSISARSLSNLARNYGWH